MTEKMKKIFALMLACMMALLISVAAYADEIPADEMTAEEEAATAEELEEQGEEDFVDDELIEIDDDWGYISPEVIEQHTPEMTQEFIHADDPDWNPEKKEEPAAPAGEPESELAQDDAEESEKNSEPVNEKEPVDVTEEDKEEAADVTEDQDEQKVEEKAEDLTEEKAEDQVEEKIEDQAEEETGSGEEEITEEEIKEETSKVTVKIRTSMRSENLMHLKAEINDPEEKEYDYQWQVSVDGGENYEDCEDQTEDFMDVELDEENLNNLWRVKVRAI